MLRPRETREEIEMFPIDTIGTCRARSCVRKDKKKETKKESVLLLFSVYRSATVQTLTTTCRVNGPKGKKRKKVRPFLFWKQKIVCTC